MAVAKRCFCSHIFWHIIWRTQFSTIYHVFRKRKGPSYGWTIEPNRKTIMNIRNKYDKFVSVTQAHTTQHGKPKYWFQNCFYWFSRMR